METNNNVHNTWCGITSGLFVIALIFLILELKHCTGSRTFTNPGKPVASDTVTKYIYSNKWFPLVVKVKEPGDSIPYPVPATVDTLAILKAHFTEYNYTDTIQDTNILAVSRIKVFENKIRDHKLDYKLLRPDKQITITNTLEKPAKPILLIGASMSLDKQFSFGLGPEALFVSKRLQTFGIGYDLLNKRVTAKVYFPIRFR
ncbi:MAG: hypothetical protein JST26_04880 [Bacteroidetes bacterium]|nr:hypothetical protein [Bacteroidota bacterium]